MKKIGLDEPLSDESSFNKRITIQLKELNLKTRKEDRIII